MAEPNRRCTYCTHARKIRRRRTVGAVMACVCLLATFLVTIPSPPKSLPVVLAMVLLPGCGLIAGVVVLIAGLVQRIPSHTCS